MCFKMRWFACVVLVKDDTGVGVSSEWCEVARTCLRPKWKRLVNVPYVLHEGIFHCLSHCILEMSEQVCLCVCVNRTAQTCCCC